jgi:amino acid transporter/nucleotide-binding universal stress UspA family protein
VTDDELAKDLGLLAALTIGVGTMVGAGIFVLPAAAANSAGPAAALAFVVAGFIALFTALSISELGTAMPKAGGGYYYINDALGPLFGSIAGWGNWLGLAFATAFYMIGFGSYATIFFPIPGFLFLEPAQVAALVAGAFFVGVNYYGTKETGRLQVVIVIILIAILTVSTAFGLFHVDTANLQPFAPAETGGWFAILPAAGLIFVTYLGFAEINTVAEELKDPGKNLPRAVIGSLLFVIALYGLVMLVVMGIEPYDEIAGFGEQAVALVAESILGWAGLALLTFGGLLATASSANASILASSRINFAMGRDKIVTDSLNEIHPKYATPYRSIALTGLLILGFILIGDIEVLAKAGSVLHLIVYGLLNVALIVYRETDAPGYDPDFRVPLYPVVPILGAVLSFGLIGFMEGIEIALSVLFVVFGGIWYAVYARGTVTEEGQLARYIGERSTEMPPSVVSAADAVRPQNSEYRVLVPLANPERQGDLLDLGCSIARNRGGSVVAVHVVQVPEQTPPGARDLALAELDTDSEELLAAARTRAESYDVPIETHTIASRRSFDMVFDTAREYGADLAVIGWGRERRWSAGRAQRGLSQLTGGVPCDFLVYRTERFDPSTILLPTVGGPDTELGAEVARTLRDEHGAEIRLLTVVGEDEREEGERFLAEWAEEHDLSDAELLVDTSGDPERAITRESERASTTILGATGVGIVPRAIGGSIAFELFEEGDRSVILAERERDRTLRERLFGR